MLSIPYKLGLRTAVTLTALLLTACTNMADTPPGTSLAQIEAQFGAPTYTCTDRDGNKRAIWSTQPYGQYAWGANIDSAGNTDQVRPLFTTEYFSLLDQGSWNKEQVRCQFGPPADRSAVGLPSSRQEVWSYRYKQSGAWNSLMYVYFDPHTGLVTRHHSGPDPVYDGDRTWLY